MGSCFLLRTEFHYGKTKRVPEMDGGDGRATVRMYLMPLHGTVKNG